MIALQAELELICAERGHQPRAVKVWGDRRRAQVLAFSLQCWRCGLPLDPSDERSDGTPTPRGPRTWVLVPCNLAPPDGTPGGLPFGSMPA